MCIFFFFNDTATTEIYTLSLHDALPIFIVVLPSRNRCLVGRAATYDGSGNVITKSTTCRRPRKTRPRNTRSEEHTSELQSRQYLVCRLLLEKKTHPVFLNVYRLRLLSSD